MTDKRRADLTRWHVRSEKQEPDLYPGGVHPDRPWEHLLEFPDIKAWFLTGEVEPEFWGDLTERDLDAYLNRARYLVAYVAARVPDHRDESGASFDEDPSVWLMSETKDGGRAEMTRLAKEAEQFVDHREESDEPLADVACRENERRAQWVAAHERAQRLTAGLPPEEGAHQWVMTQLTHLDTHEAREAWLDNFEASIHRLRAEQIARATNPPTYAAKGA